VTKLLTITHAYEERLPFGFFFGFFIIVIPTLQHCFLTLQELHKPTYRTCTYTTVSPQVTQLRILVTELVITLLLHHKVTQITQPRYRAVTYACHYRVNKVLLHDNLLHLKIIFS